MKKLGFGLMRLPYSDDTTFGNVDLESTQKMIDEFIKQGFTYFDTAWPYHGGHSEEIFGKLIASRYNRDEFQVASKMPLWEVKEESDLQRIFDKQLEKCQVSYFDVYLLHSVYKEKIDLIEEVHGFEFLTKMKNAGKIKQIGFSFHDNAEVLDEILTNHPEVEVVQLQINYIDWESDDVQSKKCYEVALKHNKKIIVMEPLKGGNLASLRQEIQQVFYDINPSLSVASWAIRFAASLENVTIVLSGMSNISQLKDNTSYMSDFKPLNDKEKNTILCVTEQIKNLILVSCTQCNYCKDGCPKKIQISEFFRIYNDQNKFGLTGPIKWKYGELCKTSKPDDCINCKKCEEHCPQNIKITEELKNVTKVFG